MTEMIEALGAAGTGYCEMDEALGAATTLTDGLTELSTQVSARVHLNLYETIVSTWWPIPSVHKNVQGLLSVVIESGSCGVLPGRFVLVYTVCAGFPNQWYVFRDHVGSCLEGLS